MPKIWIGTPSCSTITLRSRSSCIGAAPQLSGTTPRENGSRVAPVSWLPSEPYMPSGGSSRASCSSTACSPRGWVTMSPVTATMSGCCSTPNETAIRIVRRFSEGLPA